MSRGVMDGQVYEQKVKYLSDTQIWRYKECQPRKDASEVYHHQGGDDSPLPPFTCVGGPSPGGPGSQHS